MHCNDEDVDENVDEDEDEEIDYMHQFRFRDSSCTRGETMNGSSYCASCFDSRRAFIRRCISAVELREKAKIYLHPNINDRYLPTTSLKQRKIKSQREQIKLTNKNRDYYKQLHLNNSNRKNGVSVDINDTTDAVFNYENTEHFAKFLGEEVSENSISQYLFKEACRKQQIAKKSGLTAVTHCGLVWLVFGVAGFACTYLDEDESMVLHQGRIGTDVCEHFFAMIRNINPNPTLQQCRQCASKCANFVKSNIFSFKGKQNAAGAPKDHSDYIQPMYKWPKKSKRK